MKGKDALAQGGKKLMGALGKYKLVLLVILAGMVLLMLPLSGEGGSAVSGGTPPSEQAFDLVGLEKKLEKALSLVDGAGGVSVVLTVKAGTRQVWAQDTVSAQRDGTIEDSRSTVVVATGSGKEEAVSLQQIYPQFQGALVVCPGGGDPVVQLKLMEAVSALTGLGADKISICKAK